MSGNDFTSRFIPKKKKIEKNDTNTSISNVANNPDSIIKNNVTINDTSMNKSKVNDTDIISIPKVETQEKKYVSLYLRKDVAIRLEQFVQAQIKKQKLKNPKIKSFYGEIAIDEFLKKHGY